MVGKSNPQILAEVLHEQTWRYFDGSCCHVVLDTCSGLAQFDMAFGVSSPRGSRLCVACHCAALSWSALMEAMQALEF